MVSKKNTIKFTVAIFAVIGATAAAIWLSKPNKRFADDIYFPVGVFGPHENGMNWAAKVYSSSLASMQEPSLSSLKDGNVEAYRFLWVRSFHPPVALRLWRIGKQAYLSVKELSDVGVPRDGKVDFPKTLKVNQ